MIVVRVDQYDEDSTILESRNVELAGVPRTGDYVLIDPEGYPSQVQRVTWTPGEAPRVAVL